MAGSGLLFVGFLVSFIYALTKSKTKWKTAFLVLGTMAIFFGIAYAMSLFANPAVIGTLAGTLIPIIGIAASLMLAKREQTPKP